MTISYHITSVGQHKANIPAYAATGADLDCVIRDYLALGGDLAILRIQPFVVLDTQDLGAPAEAEIAAMHATMTGELDLDLAALALRNTHKPHRLAKDLAGDLWEFISYPYVDRGHVAIRIRVPGDPTSMIIADAYQLDPENRGCLCAEAGRDFYLHPNYYRDRSARLHLCPAILA